MEPKTEKTETNPRQKFRGKIGRRLALGMLLTTLIPLGFFGYISFSSSREVLIAGTVSEISGGVEKHSSEISLVLGGFGRDVIFLSNTPPLQGIIRAQENNGKDPLDGSTLKEWKDRLGVIFKEIAKANNEYLQIRYIDENGKEQVRVNSSKEGVIIRVDEKDLQNKANRYYFIDTIKKEKGEIFVSKLDLNREGDPPEPEFPYKPVIRYGTPVLDDITGQQKGALIVNIQADTFLNSFYGSSSLGNKQNQEMFIDKDGYYFVNPESRKKWGSQEDLGTGENFKNDFPKEIVSQVLSGKSGIVNSETFDSIISYHAIFPDNKNKEDFWVIIRSVPKDVFLAPVFELRNIQISIAILFALAAILLSVLFSRTISRPISSLTKMAESLSRGDLSERSSVVSNNEIGILASVFNKMADHIIDAQSNLEGKVKERTSEIDKKTKSLQQQQLAMLNILEDVDEEKGKVERNSKKNELILSSMEDGVMVVSTEGMIEFINQAGLKILGRSKEDLSGRGLVTVLKPKLSGKPVTEEYWQGVLEQLRTGTVKGEAGLEFSKKDGKLFNVDIVGSPLIVGGETEGSILVFRDITKEHEIDQMKTEFVSLASHQLKTPVAGNQWALDVLLAGKKGKLTEEAAKILNQVYLNNHRMIGLVDDLLNVSRISEGRMADNPEEFSVLKTMQENVEELEHQIKEKEINFVIVNKLAGDPRLFIDKNHFFEVIGNLFSNAIKYSKVAGKVLVNIEENGSYIRISVKDDGVGIPEKEQENIFGRFFRASNAALSNTTGSGLGLFFVKHYIESWGGKAWFKRRERNKNNCLFCPEKCLWKFKKFN
jgi:methyl-accepting chemotaxis protein